MEEKSEWDPPGDEATSHGKAAAHGHAHMGIWAALAKADRPWIFAPKFEIEQGPAEPLRVGKQRRRYRREPFVQKREGVRTEHIDSRRL